MQKLTAEEITRRLEDILDSFNVKLDGTDSSKIEDPNREPILITYYRLPNNPPYGVIIKVDMNEEESISLSLAYINNINTDLSYVPLSLNSGYITPMSLSKLALSVASPHKVFEKSNDIALILRSPFRDLEIVRIIRGNILTDMPNIVTKEIVLKQTYQSPIDMITEILKLVKKYEEVNYLKYGTILYETVVNKIGVYRQNDLFKERVIKATDYLKETVGEPVLPEALIKEIKRVGIPKALKILREI